MTDRRLRLMCESQRDIPSAVVLVLLDRLAALAVAARGYRERAERAEGLLASHAATVASCEAGSPRDALGDTPARDRAAAGIVSAAHYGRMGA